MRKQLQDVLARPDILVQVPRIRKDVWQRIVPEPSDVLIISESCLPKSLKSQLDSLQSQSDSPAVVVLTASVDPKVQVQFLADGCDAVLYSGLAVGQIRNAIEAMLEKRRRQTQKRFFTPQPLAEPKLADFVSGSSAMASFMDMVPRVVQSDTTLLIEGETGVGKERLACAIHAEGPRSKSRFVALNCGALPEHLLESELFGHVRGAFTGATSARRGWFEIAHGGTLFLDEVGEIPIHLQVKLLRVLQEHEIQPIGSEKSFGVDVRIISAGNRSLESEVESGRFRRDLYHRLSVVTITVPALRERKEDIEVIVNRHITYISQQMNRRVTGISPNAMQALCRYSWPGNVRELNNVIERAILLCDNSEITTSNLPKAIINPSVDELEPKTKDHVLLPQEWLTLPLQEVRKAFTFDLERQYIKALLNSTNGRIGEAAKRAGLQERSLYEKMKQHGLRKEDYRQSSEN